MSIHPKPDQSFSICFCLQITFPSKPFWGLGFFTMHRNLTPLHYFPLQLPLKNRSGTCTLLLRENPLVLGWDDHFPNACREMRVHCPLTVQVRLLQQDFNIKPLLQLSALSVVLSSSSKICCLPQDVRERHMKKKTTHQDWLGECFKSTYRLFFLLLNETRVRSENRVD